MSDDLSLFVGAANEAVKRDFRAGTWRVWERYDKKTYKGNIYVLAQDGASYEEIRPLQVEGLFLEFARLADEGEVTQEVWLDWVERYGVLGLEWRDPMDAMGIGYFGPVCQEGGPNESYENFRTEAWRANWVLKLLEAAGSPEGPNFAEFIEEVFDIRGHPFQERARRVSIDEAKSWAVRVVYEVVREQIRECYPTVLPVDGGFVQGWGFPSVISAMYLQLMWLLTATGEAVRWCKRPECTRVVAYEQPEQSMVIKGYTKKNDRSKEYRTRSDKEFCSDRCRGLYHYHYVKKKGKSRLKDTG